MQEKRVPHAMASDNFRMVAKTIFGLEETCASELRKLGAENIEIHNRAVSFEGNHGVMYKANLYLRTALRILVPIHEFEVEDEHDFYRKIKDINWEQYLFVDDTLAIDTVLNTSLFNHSQYISQKAKDAIVDQFREKRGKRPSVDLDRPTVRLHIHIYYRRVTIALDSSGDSLHKRGYREKTNLAPINEALAAGLVLLSGWDGRSNFIDPMCGSGTILIEAAMIAANIPAGIHREWFGFQSWKVFMPYDEDLWNTIYNAAIDRISHEEVKLYGGDVSPHVMRKARENTKRAKVDDMIQIRNMDMRAFEVPAGRGTVIVNPPYGERMDKDDLNALYKQIGDTFKQRFAGYDCWMISSNLEAFKHVGLRPSRKITVYNGQLECKFMKYSMYSGKKYSEHAND
ncbi:MAG: THUMP domain-containing protein [Chitinophagales bacterium]